MPRVFAGLLRTVLRAARLQGRAEWLAVSLPPSTRKLRQVVIVGPGCGEARREPPGNGSILRPGHRDEKDAVLPPAETLSGADGPHA